MPLLEKTFSALRDACVKLNLTEFEIYGYEEQGLTLEAEGGQLENQEAAQERGVALRVRVDGRQGLAATHDLGAPDWLAQQALSAAKANDPRPLPPFRVYSRERYQALSRYDASLAATPFSEKRSLVLAVEASAKSQPKIERVLSSVYQEQKEHVRIWSTSGLDVETESTSVALSCQVSAASKGDVREGFEAKDSFFLSSLDPRFVGEGAAQKASSLLGAKPVSSRRCAAIFAPYAAVELLSVLSGSFSAESVRKGTSRLAGKEGAKIASGAVSLLDDPFTLEGGAASPFDAEGTPTQRLTLIEEGVLQGFLYDEVEAFLAKKSSTGHAVKGDLESLPSISHSNLMIKAGEKTQEALLLEMNEGLLVQGLIGSHLANETTGEFSFGAVGQWIKKGKIQRPVAEITIAGDLFSLLGQVVAVGADLRFYGSLGSPSLWVRDLSISG